ncbi:MAG: 50S ribosomal protein L29 [bacterium]
MIAAKFREFSDEELIQKEADLREDLFKLKFQHASQQLQNTCRIKEVKKDIGRLLTIWRERIKGIR